MKKYLINEKDYKKYIDSLIGSTFAILFLYEEKNKFIDCYVEDLIEEFVAFKNYSDSFSLRETEEWYMKIILNLMVLKENIQISDNHKKVKKKTLFITNTLEKHLKAMR